MTDKAMTFSYLDSDYLKIGIIGPKQTGKSTYAVALCNFLNKKPIIFAKSYSKYMVNLTCQLYFLSGDNDNQHIIEVTKNISDDNIIIFDEIDPYQANYNYIHITQTIFGINNYNNIITCYKQKDYLNVIYNYCINIGLKLDYATYENKLDHTPYTFNLINNNGIYSSIANNNNIITNFISANNTNNTINNIKFKKNFFIGIFGQRECGKSSLILNILKNIENTVDYCIIYDPLCDTYKNKYKYDNMKNLNYEIKNNVNFNELENIIEYQKNNPDKHIVFIFDCVILKNFFKEKVIDDLILNSRHYNISIIYSMQFSLNIPPEVRCNLDYVFIFNNINISEQKRLYDHYCGIYESFNIFHAVISNIKDYDSLVIGIDKLPKIISHNEIELTKKLNKFNGLNKLDELITIDNNIIKELRIIREKCDAIEKYLIELKIV